MEILKNKQASNLLNNSIKQGQYKNDYEFNRWFIRSRNRAEYAMTYLSISERLREIQFTSVLELGPGPGTWTRLLYRKNRNAKFQLIDITKAMKEQFELEMRDLPNITYIVKDVMEFEPTETYNFFFSSRVVEYLDDKKTFFQKLYTFIQSDGNGLIVTKNPYHGVRKTKHPGHQGQIPMPEMKNMLVDNGFTNIKFYPVVIRIPIISRFTSELSEYLLEKNINRELDISAINRTVESYVVTFTKPA